MYNSKLTQCPLCITLYSNSRTPVLFTHCIISNSTMAVFSSPCIVFYTRTPVSSSHNVMYSSRRPLSSSLCIISNARTEPVYTTLYPLPEHQYCPLTASYLIPEHQYPFLPALYPMLKQLHYIQLQTPLFSIQCITMNSEHQYCFIFNSRTPMSSSPRIIFSSAETVSSHHCTISNS